MQRLRLDVRNGGQRLKGKQTTTRVESDPAQTLPEMPHEVCETVAEAVALPLVDGERALRRVDDRERGRARMNSGPAQFFELRDHLGTARENRERSAEPFRQRASNDQPPQCHRAPSRRSGAAPPVWGVRCGVCAQYSQGLRVVDDEVSVSLPESASSSPGAARSGPWPCKVHLLRRPDDARSLCHAAEATPAQQDHATGKMMSARPSRLRAQPRSVQSDRFRRRCRSRCGRAPARQTSPKRGGASTERARPARSPEAARGPARGRRPPAPVRARLDAPSSAAPMAEVRHGHGEGPSRARM